QRSGSGSPASCWRASTSSAGSRSPRGCWRCTRRRNAELAILPIDNTTDLSIAADAAHAVNPWVALAYLVAGVCFILALRGLSSPSTSQRGNRFGMAGMLIAVVTTLVTHEIASLPEIGGAIAIGGA